MQLVPSASTRKRLEAASLRYAEALAGTDASQWLASRGIGSEAQSYFRLGLAASPALGDEGFRGRITIPYLTAGGVTTIRFRRFPDDRQGPKYLSYPGENGQGSGEFAEDRADEKPKFGRIYNTEAFERGSKQGFICVTEGEFDAMAATAAGLPAVGIPGTKAWRPYFWRAFRAYPSILVLTDGDEAGEKLGKAVMATCENVRVVRMPDDYDVNKYYVERGSDGLRRFVLG